MDGILVINKPPGITSHDVVDIIRGKFNIKRVGHAGTLDPIATGVLVVLIGKATKLSNTFINDDKEYVATLFLGKSTDTQDSTGSIIEEKFVEGLSVETVKRALESFSGLRRQVPPMLSAKKYHGRKLYEFARKGEYVPRKYCNIQIYEIEFLYMYLPIVVFRVRCSKGTYIRTLCEDIGKSLNYPAHMSALVRTRSGRFSLEQAVELDNVNEKDIQYI